MIQCFDFCIIIIDLWFHLGLWLLGFWFLFCISSTPVPLGLWFRILRFSSVLVFIRLFLSQSCLMSLSCHSCPCTPRSLCSLSNPCLCTCRFSPQSSPACGHVINLHIPSCNVLSPFVFRGFPSSWFLLSSFHVWHFGLLLWSSFLCRVFPSNKAVP